MTDATPGHAPTPEELVRAVQTLAGQDTAAHDEACEALFAHLEGIAMAIVIPKIPPQDVEEVATDILADFFVYIEKGEPVPHARALLNRIGNRRIADFYRAREGVPAMREFDPDVHEGRRVSHTFELERIGEVLANDILDQLPPELRDVAHARFVAGLGVQETAHALGLTVDVVKKRSAAARERLREIVERKGYQRDS